MFGLPPKIINALCAALAQHANIHSATIYGSRAKGNYKPGSDIDLTLHGEDLTSTQTYAIQAHLDNIYFPYMVDISVYDHISNENLKAHIQRVGKTFYEKETA